MGDYDPLWFPMADYDPKYSYYQSLWSTTGSYDQTFDKSFYNDPKKEVWLFIFLNVLLKNLF